MSSRVLCLHGFNGDENQLSTRLSLLRSTISSTHSIDCLTAPHKVTTEQLQQFHQHNSIKSIQQFNTTTTNSNSNERIGYSWYENNWDYNNMKFTGISTSILAIKQQWTGINNNKNKTNNSSNYVGLFGFSQGGVIIGLLCILYERWKKNKEKQQQQQVKTTVEYVNDNELNDDNIEEYDYSWLQGLQWVIIVSSSIARDKRYTKLFPTVEEIQLYNSSSSSSSSSSASASTSIATTFTSSLISSISGLFIYGEDDSLVPSSLTLSLSDCFVSENRQIEKHEGGHFIPLNQEWIDKYGQFMREKTRKNVQKGKKKEEEKIDLLIDSSSSTPVASSSISVTTSPSDIAPSSILPSSSSSASSASSSSSLSRVLCLHGFNQTASLFSSRIASLRKSLSSSHVFHFLPAPFSVDATQIQTLIERIRINQPELAKTMEEREKEKQSKSATERGEGENQYGKAWWKWAKNKIKTEEGVEIETISFIGVASTILLVKKNWENFEFLLGFSQGAQLTALLVALYDRYLKGREEERKKEERGEEKGKRKYVSDEELNDNNIDEYDYSWMTNLKKVIIVGGNVPRDSQLKALFPISTDPTTSSSSFPSSSSLTSTSTSTSLFTCVSSLHIIGSSDQIISPIDSTILSNCFSSSHRFMLNHAGGHVVPLDAEARKTILPFLKSE